MSNTPEWYTRVPKTPDEFAEWLEQGIDISIWKDEHMDFEDDTFIRKEGESLILRDKLGFTLDVQPYTHEGAVSIGKQVLKRKLVHIPYK